MPDKEFAGGAVPPGLFRVPTEWIEGHAQAVPICQFDHDSLDSEAAHLREALLACRTDAELNAVLQRFLRRHRWEFLVEGFKTALAEIAPGRDMEANWWALCYGSGMADALGKSSPQIARMLGVTKQAFNQRVDALMARFGVRLIRLNMRDEIAREHMRKRNYRPRRATVTDQEGRPHPA